MRWNSSAKSLQEVKRNVGLFWCPPEHGRATKVWQHRKPGEILSWKRAGMHRTGSMELKCVGRKSGPDLSDSTPASVVETINKLQYLHSPELPRSKKLGLLCTGSSFAELIPCLLKGWGAGFFQVKKIPGNQIRKHQESELLLSVSFYRQMDPWKKKKK